MMFQDFLDIVLNFTFLVMFGLTLATFVPLLLSVWATWEENAEE
jgi:hypothetical protein